MKEPDWPTEAWQRAVVDRHRRFATACLVGAGLIYFATQFVEQPGFWVLLLRSGAEAGLIGGIADWFAVTALFRRPMGLPIPHTAILPRNKARLGEGLGRFVARNFLAPEVVESRMRESEPALRLAVWLQDEVNARLVADRCLALAPDVLKAFDDAEVRGFYAETFQGQVQRLDLLPLVERVLRIVVDGGHHQKLFDRSVRIAQQMLLQNRETVYRRVEERSSWWIPRRFDRRLAEAIIQGVEEWLGEIAADDHPARWELDRAAVELIDRLPASQRLRGRLDALRDEMLASAELRQVLESAWQDLRGGLLQEVESEDGTLRQALAASMQQFGATLEADPAARQRLDERLIRLLREIVLPFRDRIGHFIAAVVSDWDGETLADRLEIAVGRDLQFIRINGTLVGALVGIALFLLTQALF
ncbi:DUF445 domain-containing protein [Methylonatrum kenyense]|uniref:DUF445 domain-containing protein n=1 Tax=Methylonatrum kenyense TaxID=455253 RepID=UPI0020C04778|nr:DUF445 domain-containing protein [Methylonatrum kenyense]